MIHVEVGHEKDDAITSLCKVLTDYLLHYQTVIIHFEELPILSIRFKGEVQSRITIISKESIKISLQIGAKMMKIG